MRKWVQIQLVLAVCALASIAAAQIRVGVRVVGFPSAQVAEQVRDGVEKRLARSYEVVPRQDVQAAVRDQRGGQDRLSVDLQQVRKRIAANALVVVRATGQPGGSLLVRVTVVSDRGMQGVKRRLPSEAVGGRVPELVANTLQRIGFGGTGVATFSDEASTAAPASGSDQECTPSCRSGYLCVDGECVSACNPPCEEGERCDSNGECVVAEVERGPGPTPAPAYSSHGSMDSTTDDDWDSPASGNVEYTKRRSTGMMVGGIIFTAGGGLFAMTGLAMLALGDTRTCTEGYDGQQDCFGEDYTGIGTGMLIIGGVAVAVGVPLILHGAARVPVHASADNEASAGDTTLLLGVRSAGVQVLW